METLPILYRDDRYVAVAKPSGLLVHRSIIDRHETRFAMQLVRDQLGRRVWPIHRLDKPTSGVLLFGLDPEAARRMVELFTRRESDKRYLAVVRGWPAEEGVIDHPLREQLDPIGDALANPDKGPQPAVTDFRRLATVELPVAVDRYPASRYALLELHPHTGRKHQLRRHLKHIAHPVIGDSSYGKGVHNRYFAERLDCPRLLLAAVELSFRHPFSGAQCTVTAPLEGPFAALLDRFGWSSALPLRWLAESRAAPPSAGVSE